jgi:hypothetical protein
MRSQQESEIDPLDLYLEGYLKDYAGHYPPPALGKVQLLDAVGLLPLDISWPSVLLASFWYVCKAGLRAISFVLEDQPELEPIHSRLAMVFVSPVAFT